ncbi:MAG: GGDEF domain-containing protein [Velocimicrobium sp.]
MEANTAASIFLEDFGCMIDKNALNNMYSSVEDSVHYLKFDTASGANYYEVKIHHLLMTNGKKRGIVAVIRNITMQMIKQFELEEKAELDGLTQIFNRKTIEGEYEILKNSPISIVIIDIDKFKKINDTYGHPIGDAVIVGIVDAIKIHRYEVTCKLPAIGVSIGAFTNLEIGAISFKEAYKKADSMLYKAKQNGGNCAMIQ